jgi:type VI secretion system secreted protein Hcp
MEIYMKIPNVQGHVTTQGYKDWIKVYDVEFGGVKNGAKMTVGKMSDRISTYPNFSQISLIKPMDKSSTKLFTAAHSAEVFPSLELHYVTTGKDPSAYSKIKLSDAIINHYSEYMSEEGYPEELLTISYSKMERTYIPRAADNQAGSPMTVGYDLEQGKGM